MLFVRFLLNIIFDIYLQRHTHTRTNNNYCVCHPVCIPHWSMVVKRKSKFRPQSLINYVLFLFGFFFVSVEHFFHLKHNPQFTNLMFIFASIKYNSNVCFSNFHKLYSYTDSIVFTSELETAIWRRWWCFSFSFSFTQMLIYSI